MKENNLFETRLHYLMSFTGGFLGAYALLTRSNLFGSAQTANMISIVFNLLGKDFFSVMIRIFAVFIYASAIALAVVIPRYSRINMKLLSIICTICAVFFLGFLPSEMNNLVALYPVFFVTAFQWSVFKGAQGYISSPIFSTNNFKQMISSFTEYGFTKDQIHLNKAKFYGFTLLSFHVGVAISYLSYLILAVQSSWVCSIPLVIALFLVCCDISEKSIFAEAAIKSAKKQEAVAINTDLGK